MMVAFCTKNLQNSAIPVQIKPYEQEIVGNWFLYQGKVVADDHCKRIDELVKNHLKYICDDKFGWDRLYKDPTSGRYWERVYLQSETHGGGPPSLIFLPREAAHSKYDFKTE